MTLLTYIQRTQDFIAKPHKLDDEELSSEDDEDRAHLNDDEQDGSVNGEIHERAQTILDVNIGRHAIPKPGDGEVIRSGAFLFFRVRLTIANSSFTSFNSPTSWELTRKLFTTRISNLQSLTTTFPNHPHRHSHPIKLRTIQYGGDIHPGILQKYSQMHVSYAGRMDPSQYSSLQTPENNTSLQQNL